MRSGRKTNPEESAPNRQGNGDASSDGDLRRWRNDAEHYSSEGRTSKRSRLNFFENAFKYVQSDAGSMQTVLKALASEGGLRKVLQLVKDDHDGYTSDGELKQHISTIISFLRVISYPQVLNSGLLETWVGTLYNTLFGPNGQHCLKVFRFLVAHMESMPAEDMEPNVIVFAKTLDLNGSAALNDDFSQLAELLSAAISEDALDDQNSPAAINMHRWMRRAKHRLGMRNLPMVKRQKSRSTERPRAQFEFTLDFPGQLSETGPRHDNDFEDIRQIQIMPTYEEVTSDREPYLPVLDASKLHLQGIEGLIDRHFRLYREDVVGPLRDALKAQLIPDARAGQGVRVHCYPGLRLETLRCHDYQGFVVTVSVEQPKLAAERGRRTVSERELDEWWTSKRRLERDSLVCILDPAGRLTFCTVVEIRVHERKDRDRDNHYDDTITDSGEENFSVEELQKSYRDLSSNPRRALFTIVPVEESGINSFVEYFTGRWPVGNLRLVELPKFMLGTFKPTLEALQAMISSVDIPFADLLASVDASSDTVEVGAPLYARQRGFRYDLRCLLTDRTPIYLSPTEEFNLKTLTDQSSLDAKQAEALTKALCRRLAICQGPPGTGKSYTAVALVKTLLANKRAAALGPILAVTYTNHALDQDLENFLDSGITQIIRIGSQYKSERLADINLKNVTSKSTRTQLEWKTKRDCMHDMFNQARGPVSDAIQNLVTDGSDENLKIYPQDKWPEFHDQFYGEDDEGFRVHTSGKQSIFDLWLSGRLGTGDGIGRVRNVDELLDRAVNIREMSPEERGALYRFWRTEMEEIGRRDFLAAVRDYQDCRKKFQAASHEVDLRCLSEANIIGITTSGLARNYPLLKRLPFKAVLVEEAGEILEAHTLTAFLPSMEHGILIGDHLQLKSTVAIIISRPKVTRERHTP